MESTCKGFWQIWLRPANGLDKGVRPPLGFTKLLLSCCQTLSVPKLPGLLLFCSKSSQGASGHVLRSPTPTRQTPEPQSDVRAGGDNQSSTSFVCGAQFGKHGQSSPTRLGPFRRSYAKQGWLELGEEEDLPHNF